MQLAGAHEGQDGTALPDLTRLPRVGNIDDRDESGALLLPLPESHGDIFRVEPLGLRLGRLDRWALGLERRQRRRAGVRPRNFNLLSAEGVDLAPQAVQLVAVGEARRVARLAVLAVARAVVRLGDQRRDIEPRPKLGVELVHVVGRTIEHRLPLGDQDRLARPDLGIERPPGRLPFVRVGDRLGGPGMRAAVIAPGGPLGGLPLGPLLGGELGALQARLDRFGVRCRAEAVRGRVEAGLERGFA